MLIYLLHIVNIFLFSFANVGVSVYSHVCKSKKLTTLSFYTKKNTSCCSTKKACCKNKKIHYIQAQKQLHKKNNSVATQKNTGESCVQKSKCCTDNTYYLKSAIQSIIYADYYKEAIQSDALPGINNNTTIPNTSPYYKTPSRETSLVNISKTPSPKVFLYLLYEVLLC